MNLSDVNPTDITPVASASAPTAASAPLTLADVNPDDVIAAPTTEAEEKFGGPTGALAAFTGHAVNSVIPGGTRLLGQDPATTQQLTEANPISSAAGDVLGFVRGAKTLGSLGAPGLITKAGGAVGELAAPLGSLAAKAAQFGTEGALMGAAQTANEAALGDPNLTGQKALANIGWGAALGVGAAPLAQAAEAFLPAATKKLSGALSNLKESVLGTAEEPTLAAKTLAGASSLTNKAGYDANLQTLFAGLESGETTIPKLTKNIENVFEHGSTVSDSLTESLEKDLKPALTEGPIKNFPPKSDAPLFSDVSPEKLEANLKTKEMLFDYQKASDEFRNEFMDAKKAAIDPSKVETVFTKFNDPEYAGKKEVLDNYLAQSKRVLEASENYANYEDAEKSISKMVNTLASKNVEMQDVLKSMIGRPKGPALLKDAAIGTALHMAGVSNPVVGAVLSGVEMYRAVSNPFEMGTQLNSAFQKIKALAEINEKVGEKITQLSKSALTNTGTRTALAGLPQLASQKDYEKSSGRIAELASNPQALQDHIAMHTEDLYQDAPNVSAGLSTTMANGVGFLNSKIPRPPNQSILSEKWEPSKAEKQNFMEYYRAVTKPLSALQDVKAGTLSQKTMEALQATQPHLLKEIRTNVMEHLNPKKALKLPYHVKMSLSLLMGEPMVEGMLPSVIANNQLTFAGPQQSSQNAPKQSKTTQGGLKALNIAGRSETETQEHEEEEV